MLPNEIFALECRAYYDSIGLVVDETNGEFAHCPYPRGMGETGYYLLHEHHQQQGILQSQDVGECCFFSGDTKKWLLSCSPFPDNYFELWDIYEKYASLNASKAAKTGHAEKDDLGRSVHAMETLGKLHAEKDDLGRSVHAMKTIEIARTAHTEKDELGRSVYAVKAAKACHSEKYPDGRSINAVKCGQAAKLKRQRSVQLTRICDSAVFTFDCISDAARNLNLHYQIIVAICRGKRKTTGGYTARYL